MRLHKEQKSNVLANFKLETTQVTSQQKQLASTELQSLTIWLFL